MSGCCDLAEQPWGPQQTQTFAEVLDSDARACRLTFQGLRAGPPPYVVAPYQSEHQSRSEARTKSRAGLAEGRRRRPEPEAQC